MIILIAVLGALLGILLIQENILLQPQTSKSAPSEILTYQEKKSLDQAKENFRNSDSLRIDTFDPLLEPYVFGNDIEKIKAIASEVDGMHDDLILSACRIAYNNDQQDILNQLAKEFEGHPSESERISLRVMCLEALPYWH
jgi:hypothetical protein